MPCHPDRVRRAGLPARYQFGHGAHPPARRWRPAHENTAARRVSTAFRITQAQLAWDADHRRARAYEDGEVRVPEWPTELTAEIPPRADDVWDKQPIPERGWNVIEGEQH
jgi:hypothetical protein